MHLRLHEGPTVREARRVDPVTVDVQARAERVVQLAQEEHVVRHRELGRIHGVLLDLVGVPLRLRGAVDEQIGQRLGVHRDELEHFGGVIPRRVVDGVLRRLTRAVEHVHDRIGRVLRRVRARHVDEEPPGLRIGCGDERVRRGRAGNVAQRVRPSAERTGQHGNRGSVRRGPHRGVNPDRRQEQKTERVADECGEHCVPRETVRDVDGLDFTPTAVQCGPRTARDPGAPRCHEWTR